MEHAGYGRVRVEKRRACRAGYTVYSASREESMDMYPDSRVLAAGDEFMRTRRRPINAEDPSLV